MDICSLTLTELVKELRTENVSSQKVVAAYLERIEMNDQNGPMLNAAPILNPEAIKTALERDAERAAGKVRGQLHGVPFLVKDSFAVKGLPVSNGSPAFSDCIANHDSWVVERLKDEGAIVLGKTTMPPMAAGGMQQGIYGIAKSPFNQHYHPAAWFSGSSQGSGVGLAAGYAPFAIGEETVSSGRSPASYNGIVCYTPSNGLISIDRSWPLLPLRDVVAPFTQNIDDLLFLLKFFWSRPQEPETDFWLRQNYISVFEPEPALQELTQNNETFSPQSVRLGFVDRWSNDLSHKGFEGSVAVASLVDDVVERLKETGFGVETTDFPLLDAYSSHGVLTPNPDPLSEQLETLSTREFATIATAGWELFLRKNGSANVSSLSEVDSEDIFPEGFKGLPQKYNPLPPIHIDKEIPELSDDALEKLLFENPEIESAVKALENFRERHLDSWMQEKNLDILIFPANSDHASVSAGTSPQATINAWKEGVACSTGNFMVRQLGLPTVTLPIGVRKDNGMPVGLTLLSTPGQDVALLKIAQQVERILAPKRCLPTRIATMSHQNDHEVVPSA